MLKVLLTQIYLAIRKPLSNVLIIGDWGPVVNDTIVKNKFIQIFFNYLKTKQINDELTLALLFLSFQTHPNEIKRSWVHLLLGKHCGFCQERQLYHYLIT